jgi:hypothetical protein
MRDTSKYAKESLTQSSRALMKNKARLSTMTAFSFGYNLKHMNIDLLNPFKQASFMVFLLRFTAKNETSNLSLVSTIMTLLKVLPCQPSPEGGIILFHLLVSV